MKPLVYLAGPISDCTYGEANDWRRDVSFKLDSVGMCGISPLRCEPLVGERYTTGSPDPCFGTARAIASKNFLDVQTCHITLCYLPLAANKRRLSIGTLIELAWAHALRKPTILVTEDPFLIEHPVVQANASWVVPTLNDALEVIRGVYGDYCV